MTLKYLVRKELVKFFRTYYVCSIKRRKKTIIFVRGKKALIHSLYVIHLDVSLNPSV